MLKKFLKKVSLNELIWYIASIFIMIIGLIFIILGIVGDSLPVDNPLRKVQENFSWRYIGLIIFAFAVIVFIIVLLIYGKKAERVMDREARRKQRLQAMLSDNEEKKETIIVDEHGKIEHKKVSTVEINETKTEAINNKDEAFKDAVITDIKKK